SHGHNANNAFLLNIDGQTALRRSGRRDVHGSPHHTEYMWHSKSDNAILVNGEGQIRHSSRATGRIVRSEIAAEIDMVEGEAGSSYENLDRWTRRVIFLKPSIIVLHDVLEAPEPSTFQFTLHAADTPFELSQDAAAWRGENGAVEVRFLEPADMLIEQTNKTDPPPAEWASFKLNEWHLTASTNEKRANQQFITCIGVKDVAFESALEPLDSGGTRLRIETGGEHAELEL